MLSFHFHSGRTKQNHTYTCACTRYCTPSSFRPQNVYSSSAALSMNAARYGGSSTPAGSGYSGRSARWNVSSGLQQKNVYKHRTTCEQIQRSLSGSKVRVCLNAGGHFSCQAAHVQFWQRQRLLWVLMLGKKYLRLVCNHPSLSIVSVVYYNRSSLKIIMHAIVHSV